MYNLMMKTAIRIPVKQWARSGKFLVTVLTRKLPI